MLPKKRDESQLKYHRSSSMSTDFRYSFNAGLFDHSHRISIIHKTQAEAAESKILESSLLMM